MFRNLTKPLKRWAFKKAKKYTYYYISIYNKKYIIKYLKKINKIAILKNNINHIYLINKIHNIELINNINNYNNFDNITDILKILNNYLLNSSDMLYYDYEIVYNFAIYILFKRIK